VLVALLLLAVSNQVQTKYESMQRLTLAALVRLVSSTAALYQGIVSSCPMPVWASLPKMLFQ
jgi:hypothetical protein